MVPQDLFGRYFGGNELKDKVLRVTFNIVYYCILLSQVMMRTLDQHRRKVYVSPRVLQQTLNYVNQAVGHAFSWKMLKPHSAAVIQEVLFPILCYTDADEELWQCDPHEYIRTKFDIFEDYVSPVMAAQTLLHTICKKRKDQLQKTMEFLMQVFSYVQYLINFTLLLIFFKNCLL